MCGELFWLFVDKITENYQGFVEHFCGGFAVSQLAGVGGS